MSVKAKADAIDRFVRTLKSGGGLWDDINAACIMAGWTNLAGALYPLKGAAPTNNGFLAADYESTLGIETTYNVANYINANYPANTSPTDDTHASCYLCSKATIVSPNPYASLLGNSSGSNGFFVRFATSVNGLQSRPYSYVDTPTVSGVLDSIGLVGFSRSDNANATLYVNSQGTLATAAAAGPFANSIYVGAVGSNNTPSVAGADYRFSFYSLGTATDLAALDSAVSTLMADLRAIDEDGFDRDALAYIRAVEAADGAYLETGVKKAINRFIVGCKKDGTWNAIKASCIMCGARTLAGALVPLAGTAPTPYNFVAGDYNRKTGLAGNGSTKYLNTNRANNADGTDNHHLSVYSTNSPPESNISLAGAFDGSSVTSLYKATGDAWLLYDGGFDYSAGPVTNISLVGLVGLTRSGSGSFSGRIAGVPVSAAAPSSNFGPLNHFIFGYNATGSLGAPTSARAAFYSVGTAIDLAALDARVSTLVSQIAAAIP